jgi:hypothetical protein
MARTIAATSGRSGTDESGSIRGHIFDLGGGDHPGNWSNRSSRWWTTPAGQWHRSSTPAGSYAAPGQLRRRHVQPGGWAVFRREFGASMIDT